MQAQRFMNPYEQLHGGLHVTFEDNVTPHSLVKDGARLMGSRDGFYALVKQTTGMSYNALNKLPQPAQLNFLKQCVNMIFQSLCRLITQPLPCSHIFPAFI